MLTCDITMPWPQPSAKSDTPHTHTQDTHIHKHTHIPHAHTHTHNTLGNEAIVGVPQGDAINAGGKGTHERGQEFRGGRDMGP